MNWKPSRRVIATLLVTALMLVAGCTGPSDGGNGTVADGGDGAAVGPTDEPAAGDDGGAGTTATEGAMMGNETTTDDSALGNDTTETEGL